MKLEMKQLTFVAILAAVVAHTCAQVPVVRMPAQGVALSWTLEVDGINLANFQRVTGLDSEAEVIERRMGANGKLIIQRTPGQVKSPRIVLRRGLTLNDKLAKWRGQIERGLIGQSLKNCSIAHYGPGMQVLARYVVKSAWPSKYQARPVGKTGRIGILELDLDNRGITRTQ